MFKFLFGKKSVPLKDVFEAGKVGAMGRNEKAVEQSLAQLQERLAEDKVQGEALYGLLILMSCEFGLRCVGPHVGFFLQEFPDSISPVKVELAANLANQEQYDSASQYSREYLRVVRDGGHLDNLAGMPIARRGTSRALLLLTSAYTHCGARSHSERVIRYALSLPTDPGFHGAYNNEMARLQGELADSAARALDARWEEFFATGAGMAELATHCENRGCPLLAKRLELSELNFRMKPDHRPTMSDEMLLVRHTTGTGQPIFMLG